MTIISLGQESLTCTACPMQMCTNLKTYDWRQRLHFTMKQCAQNPTVAYINGHANLRIGNIIRDCRIGHDARRWRPAACQKPRKTKTRQASDRRRGKLTTTTTIMTMTMRAMARADSYIHVDVERDCIIVNQLDWRGHAQIDTQWPTDRPSPVICR